MKILRSEHIRYLDTVTIENQYNGYSTDLMEKASKVFFQWMMEHKPGHLDDIILFCGSGNNGGDGLAVARMSLPYFKKVIVYIIHFSSSLSADTKIMLQKLPDEVEVIHIRENDTLSMNLKNSLIIDAIFGSGLTRPVMGYWAEVLQFINANSPYIFSIDAPSGLHSDKIPDKSQTIIKAQRTLSFEMPKISFFFPESEEYTGYWEYRSIGLDKKAWDELPYYGIAITCDLAISVMKNRKVFSHKGTFGSTGIVAGSYGMAGAAALCTKASMRSGAGKTICYTPEVCLPTVQSFIPEATCVPNCGKEYIENFPSEINLQALALGCGIGTSEATSSVLWAILKQHSTIPLVLDADALNIIAYKQWLEFIPSGSILTPHPGEFKRLFGHFSNSEERVFLQQSMSEKYQIYIIYKGAFSTLSTPEGDIFFNMTGNPGMATGGSGDVLTGILAALTGQQYSRLDSCLLGMYIHGRAGDLYAQNSGMTGLIAGDIIHQLPTAWFELEESIK